MPVRAWTSSLGAFSRFKCQVCQAAGAVVGAAVRDRAASPEVLKPGLPRYLSGAFQSQSIHGEVFAKTCLSLALPWVVEMGLSARVKPKRSCRPGHAVLGEAEATWGASFCMFLRKGTGHKEGARRTASSLDGARLSRTYQFLPLARAKNYWGPVNSRASR